MKGQSENGNLSSTARRTLEALVSNISVSPVVNLYDPTSLRTIGVITWHSARFSYFNHTLRNVHRLFTDRGCPGAVRAIYPGEHYLGYLFFGHLKSNLDSLLWGEGLL